MRELQLAVAIIANISAFGSASAEAQGLNDRPWTSSVTLTSEQLEAARRLNDYANRTNNPARALGVDVDDVNWRAANDWTDPMSNMTRAGVTNLIQNNYVVMTDPAENSVMVYYHESGGNFYG